MNIDPEVLWKSLDRRMIEKLDAMHATDLWNSLVPLYKQAISEESSSAKRDVVELVVFMRTLVVEPAILNEESGKKDLFVQSAKDFYGSFVKHIKGRECGKRLVQDLFCEYATLIPNCPQAYKRDPTEFVEALAKLLLDTPFSQKTPFLLDGAFFDRTVAAHELYADFCMLAPRLAFRMAEICPLLPKEYTNGIALEETPFLPHFFSYLTVPTPFWLENRLQFFPNMLSEEDAAELLRLQGPAMSRVHAAQCAILRCFLTASYESRDYVLSLLALLVSANRSRRANPFGSVSSDGLMMNLTLCLLELLAPALERTPRERLAKKFVCYVLSDLARVDFVQANMPKDAAERDYMLNVMNWCRPTNVLARALDDARWWEAIRSSPQELGRMIDAGLECKPKSSFCSFLRSLAALSDSPCLSPRILAAKSFYDYSYNYFITGKRATPLLPARRAALLCTACKAPIPAAPYYRCVCCDAYVLCARCYAAEKERVVAAFRYPFAPEVIRLFRHPEATGQQDAQHNALTHVFTEVRTLAAAVADPRVFYPCASFTPLCPAPYEAIKERLEEAHKDQPAAFVAAYTAAVAALPLGPDDNYLFYSRGDRALLERYADTLCLCARPCGLACRLHGPLARRVFEREPCALEEGFVQHTQCYQCKSSPVIGTVFRCLHCSLELCRRCYLREMAIGAGLPSHQCNHVFILEEHPLNPRFFYQHNRNDMRTIQYAVELLPNDLAMSGVVLDQFVADRAEARLNEGNLAAELLALGVQLMQSNLTGLFQEYQVLVDFSALALHRALRDLQFGVGGMALHYLRFSEQLAYTLLCLVTLYTPSNYPLREEWRLHGVTYNMQFSMMAGAPSRDCASKLRHLVVLDVLPSPLFTVLASSFLEVVYLLFLWLVQSSDVAAVRDHVFAGRLDYTLLLLLLCLDSNVVANISTRFDVLDALYYLCTVSKEKDDVVFLFQFPVVRHFLLIFVQQALIDSSGFKDQQRAYTTQLHANKIMIILLRSRTCGNEGFDECQQLLEGLGVSANITALYIEDMIRQASNTQDMLNEVYGRIVAKAEPAATVQSLKATGQTLLENIKTVVNLFVRMIGCASTLRLLMSPYLMKRVTRFILLVLTSIAKPMYRDHTDQAYRLIRMNFAQWLRVIVDQIILLVTNAPAVDASNGEELPSPAVALDPSTQYRNSILISFVEDDGFFDLAAFEWALDYCKAHTVLSDKRVDQFERIVRLLRSYCAHFERLNAILDGCPPEFYDSIMATVMQDPVVLPSNNRCDRSTVLRQLSVNPIDPFTKMPLSMDMVKPDDELKARIHAYMQQKLNELQNPAA